jgi:hypothetical protein
VPVTCPELSSCIDFCKLKSKMMPLVVLAVEITRAGLIVIVSAEVARFAATACGTGGLTVVLSTISCGFVRVSCRPVYVPAGKLLDRLRMFVKSASRAKSTVAGAVEVIKGTGDPPCSGTRLAEAMVIMKDSTSHTGASVANMTSELEAEPAGRCDATAPHPITIAEKAMIRLDINTGIRLLINQCEYGKLINSMT